MATIMKIFFGLLIFIAMLLVALIGWLASLVGMIPEWIERGANRSFNWLEALGGEV